MAVTRRALAIIEESGRRARAEEFDAFLSERRITEPRGAYSHSRPRAQATAASTWLHGANRSHRAADADTALLLPPNLKRPPTACRAIALTVAPARSARLHISRHGGAS